MDSIVEDWYFGNRLSPVIRQRVGPVNKWPGRRLNTRNRRPQGVNVRNVPDNSTIIAKYINALIMTINDGSQLPPVGMSSNDSGMREPDTGRMIQYIRDEKNSQAICEVLLKCAVAYEYATNQQAFINVTIAMMGLKKMIPNIDSIEARDMKTLKDFVALLIGIASTGSPSVKVYVFLLQQLLDVACSIIINT